MYDEPLILRVACENPGCYAVLDAYIEQKIRQLSPPNLIIRCAKCKQSPFVSTPRDIYNPTAPMLDMHQNSLQNAQTLLHIATPSASLRHKSVADSAAPLQISRIGEDFPKKTKKRKGHPH